MNVLRVNVAHAFNGNINHFCLRAEGKARDEREFVRGVNAVYVQRGVGFGVAVVARALQCFAESQTLAVHERQNIIASAVDNTEHFRNRIARQCLAQSFHNRHATRDGGFKEDIGFAAVAVENARAFGERGFVCGDDGLALGERLANALRGVGGAAHQFNDDVGARVVRGFAP